VGINQYRSKHHAVTEHHHVFLSYSRNDQPAAINLRGQLERHGLSVFKDDERIRAGELWLDRLQEAVDGCGAFVVLVGRDGVRRWIGAETQAALNRHFAPHDDTKRLPIFPILLDGTEAETLPAFLRLFQMTRWNGADPLPERLLADIRERTIVVNDAIAFEGCPFVGLAAYRMDQAQLFFGRQKETLDALACFFDVRPGSPAVRWLEINGNSGSGKSSLMQAGLLPLIDQGWLWRPRPGYERWTRIGPMMPGEHPVEMLAESLARAFDAKMVDIVKELQGSGDGLRYWLRDRKRDDIAFLLAIDQFEELFTFSYADERRRFDRLLASALEDADCPLFVISTVRADFLDRFAEDLPRLVAAQNRLGRTWKLTPISADGLREVITGPARLANLDVSEIKAAMVAEARDEPGALPLVENALHWLWEKRTDNRLSGQLFTDQGGLAGILSSGADGLLAGRNAQERDRALDLLFRLVQVDSDSGRHTRRRIPLAEALEVAGGGERGRTLIDDLAGQRRRGGRPDEGPLRLITVTEEAEGGTTAQGRWVNLIHETLIRSKGFDAAGKPQPYWPTLWTHIEKNKERAAQRERLQLLTREWKGRKGFSRLFGLAGWSSLFGFRGLVVPGSLEQRYLRWSRARAAVEAVVLAIVIGVVGESMYWVVARGLPFEALTERWAYMLGRELPLPELVKIPAGSFMMGSGRDPREQPMHRVTFTQPFALGRTEVTFQEWDACVADSACSGYRPSDQGWGRETRPVINVSWQDAQSYVAWLSRKMGTNCRLPSEAEWEYAARGGTTTEYALPAPDGSDDIAGKGFANCFYCSSEGVVIKTTPVTNFPANAWGMHDMHGNVYEWVEDCAHATYAGAPEDGRAWLEGEGGNCSSRVMRGGGWFGYQETLRSAFRNFFQPDVRLFYIGLRVVCSSPSSGTDH
jgi:formylglycine-generating enzyme required for sulfatase activity